MKNLILCGGIGSRLWPLSRATTPKQFARILDGGTLFERTVRRNRALGCDLFVAANADQYALAVSQLEGLGVRGFGALVEPVGRNTAPAIALACLGFDPDEVVLVTPSDHLIGDEAAYAAAVRNAVGLAEAGNIVVFGIEPSYPETGFGYIELDGDRVKSFREKPDAETARRYVEAGSYFWNAGMFCFKAGTFLKELESLAPEIFIASKTAYERAAGATKPLRVARADMEAIPSISVDYAVMEKSGKIACVPCDIGWSDVGSFDALYDAMPGTGDALRGNAAEVVEVGGRGNLVLGDGRVVALVDVEDLIVVDTPDGLLITKRGSSQKVKDVVDALKKKRPEVL